MTSERKAVDTRHGPGSTFFDSLAGTFLLTSGNHGRDQSDDSPGIEAVLDWREVADATVAQGSRTGGAWQTYGALSGIVI